MTFTITSGAYYPSISFIWYPTECQRTIFSIFNINIRGTEPIVFMRTDFGADYRTLKVVGDGTTFDVWVKGSAKKSYDPYGVIQHIHAYGINSYQYYGLHDFRDEEPTGTYSATASRYGMVNYADNAGAVAWSNVSSKPDTATRWPSWSEVTSKPSTFTPASHTHNYLPLSGGLMNSGSSITFDGDTSGTPVALDNMTKMGIAYGRIQSFGNISINADTNGTQTEYILLTSGIGATNDISKGLAIGYNSLTWKGSVLLHASNWSSYCAAASHSHDDRYLKLSGGSLTGDLTTDGNVMVSNSDPLLELFDKNADSYAHTTGKIKFSCYSTHAEVAALSVASNQLTIACNKIALNNLTDDVLTITNTGYVGIGTSSPAYKLDVSGNIKASSFIKSGGTSSQFLKADGSIDSNSYSLSSHSHDSVYAKKDGTNASGTWGISISGMSSQSVIIRDTASVGTSSSYYNYYRKIGSMTISNRYGNYTGTIQYRCTCGTGDNIGGFGILYLSVYQQNPLNSNAAITFTQFGDAVRQSFYAVETNNESNTVVDLYIQVKASWHTITLTTISGNIPIVVSGDFLEELPTGSRTITPSFTAQVGSALSVPNLINSEIDAIMV